MKTPNKLLIYALAFGALILLAPLKIKLAVVPITFQTLVIFTTAALLGRRFALIATLAYLLLGALGLPVFGNYTYGLAKLTGYTAGFLWGFVPTAYYVAWDITRRETHFVNTMGTMLRAHLLLLIPGFAVLYFTYPGVNLWGTFVRLLPGLTIKTAVGGLLVTWLYSKINVHAHRPD